MYGYYPYEDECSPCTDVNAMTCGTDGVATSCWDGYWLDTDECIPCEETYGLDCSLCDETACLQCVSGALDSADGTCKDCEDTQLEGSDLFATTCTVEDNIVSVETCDYGYGVNPSGECISCGDTDYDSSGADPYASFCDVTANSITATDCVINLLNVRCLGSDGHCHEFADADPYSLTSCAFDGSEFTATCVSGYGECIPSGSSDQGCYDCGIDDSESCAFNPDSDCTEGEVASYTCSGEGVNYVDDGAGACVSCGEFCADCSYGVDAAVCSTCVERESWQFGVFLDSGTNTCMECDENCNVCNATACFVCVSIEGLDECYTEDNDDGDDSDDDDDILDEDSSNSNLGWSLFFF